MKRFKEIAGLLKGYRKELISNFFFNLLNAVFSLFTFLSVVPFLYILFRVDGGAGVTVDSAKGNPLWLWINQHLNDFIALHGQATALAIMCIAIVVLALLKNIVNYISLFSIAKIRTSVSRDLREKLYYKVLRLPLSYFSNERKGDIISRMTNDLMEIEFSVIGAMEALLKSPVMIVISLITLIVISWKLTIFAFIFLPVSGFLISRIAKSLKNAAKRGKGSLADIISVIEETLSGIRIIKVFNAEKQFGQKFDRNNDLYSRLMHRLYRREYLSSPMSEFIALAVISILLYLGGRIVISGELGGEMLIGYLVVFSQIIQPAKAFSDAIFKVNKGAASLERINEIFVAEEIILDPADPKPLTEFKSEIEFCNVRFSYADHEVLKGVNIKIKKGHTVALVGPSGSGKSTLASLLARFYDPSSGDVLIDGVPIGKYRMNDLRSLMGFVSQDSILFNDSVKNNITLGSSGIQTERMKQAARIANAEEFIVHLPGTYDFNIGDGGNKLSGGQKQRLSIARAIFKNPPILILDEATSALDTQSEKLVQEAISKLMEHRTSLVIAHRLSTVQNADLIIVLDAGNIAEQGTHDELMQKNGLYKKL
ncbi:MAG: ABC transporter ATP-binding protein, partial [Crocinitomicaceae bacterium]|nr:ABC transporter ATP-binding protein [Crocinitomicaceae bacterium]